MMKIVDTAIAGVHIVETMPIADQRGSFARNFCARELEPILKDKSIVQINQSKTVHVGTIRGMHFQRSSHAEIKFVRCIRGRIWDVALDLRAGSPTFLQWHAQELTPDNYFMLVVPEGCAHGFQALEPNSEVLYLHTSFYEPSAEGGVRYDDPVASIKWPLPLGDLSARDANYPLLNNDYLGI